MTSPATQGWKALLRPQFRLSTILILTLVTAVFLGVNITPHQRVVLANFESMDDGSWKNVEDVQFKSQGWPYYVWISDAHTLKTPFWKASKEEMEERRQNSIKWWDPYSAPVWKGDEFSIRALLLDGLIYFNSVVVIYLALDGRAMLARIRKAC